MFNYSGLIYRIWGVAGIIAVVGLIGILTARPWRKKFKISTIIIDLVFIAFAICLGLAYYSSILFPNISSYTGEFITMNRNSRVAPPLPVTYEYIFWDGEGIKPKFYLDTFSKNKIYPYEFEVGKKYTVYFDEFTSIIVRIEVECEVS